MSMFKRSSRPDRQKASPIQTRGHGRTTTITLGSKRQDDSSFLPNISRGPQRVALADQQAVRELCKEAIIDLIRSDIRQMFRNAMQDMLEKK
mmetsp:Transcript_18024/g.20063  ORF Transcript_18024/g.20063 Transcript_18024/m.20063 type:complete len:92 (+) Transcript_18024:1203-1478(+)